MNFLTGKIGTDRQSVVTENGTRLPVGPGVTAEPDMPVTYGIRPEHLSVTSGDDGIAMTVTNVEPTGAETFIQGMVGGQKLSAQLRERVFTKVGDVLHLTLLPSNSHLFDATTGIRID
jgi:multiple sugar transport system ATP-binding protein